MPVKLWKTLGRKTPLKASENAQEAFKGAQGGWDE